MSTNDGEIRREIENYVAAQLRLGFDPSDAVTEGAQSLFRSDEGYPGDAFVAGVVEERLGALIREQASWERPTDAERLDQAFQELEAMGILARHCYAPTRTWAKGELAREASIAQSRGVRLRGRVFYTSQDAEGLLHGQLHLAWGAYTEPGRTFTEDLTAADELAEDIVAALERAGLSPSWDGIASSTIFLTDLNWQHPRNPTTREPLLPTAPRYEASSSDPAPNVAGVEPTPAHPVTPRGEWLVRIAFLSNASDDGPFTNLQHFYRRMANPEPDDPGMGEFFPEGTYAFDFRPLALGQLAGRSAHFDLVAPPSSALFPASRAEFIAQVDGVVLVPTDEESLADMIQQLQEHPEGHDTPVVIELNTEAWRQEDIERIEERYGEDVVRANLHTGDGVFDVLKEIAKRALIALRDLGEATP